MNENPLIQTRQLFKKFPVGGDYFTALKDINFSVQEGEIHYTDLDKQNLDI